ncbi:MAG TPA: enoyl-CoA hydratase/isomerase family protein [Tepidisphaeraceae bacterium]|jgi:3-hydroxyacyl-CoA dehydrogenase/enoyl-CoA hydratase/3-hydroxybutyryl-CoA epimerase|nr:enoyl-CoA hydratase/isomerase family protein [Tepidisphaeraceae bacterium]
MSHVRVEIDSDRIATLWLDAPGKRVNTLSRQMWADLAEGIDEVEREKAVGVIVASAKANSFCVGADLFEIRDMSDEDFDRYIRTGQEILSRIEGLAIPTIAALNGDCIGGGFELALACSVRIALDEAKIGSMKVGLPEVHLGLVPGWGGTVRLMQLIGSKSFPLLLDGALFDPAEARRMHIIHDVLPSTELMPISKKLVIDIIAEPLLNPPHNPTNAIRFRRELQEIGRSRKLNLTRAQQRLIQVLRIGIDQGKQAGFDAERNAIVELRRTPECQQALQKFFDRRK